MAEITQHNKFNEICIFEYIPFQKLLLVGRRGPGLNLPSRDCEYSVVSWRTQDPKKYDHISKHKSAYQELAALVEATRNPDTEAGEVVHGRVLAGSDQSAAVGPLSHTRTVFREWNRWDTMEN